MSISQSRALTRQFYEWELRGRGWHKSDYAVDLEPPFVPFFGHFIERAEIIDDGRVPHWLDRMFGARKPSPPPKREEEPIAAFPYTDDSPLSLYTVVLPRQFRPSGERMEQLVVMLSYRASPLSFELVGSREAITLQFACRERDADFLYTQLTAFLPECTVMEAETDCLLEALEADQSLYAVDFGLREEFMRPIAQYRGGDTDPYTALLGAMSRLRHGECVIVQILFSGTHSRNAWADSVMAAVTDNDGRASFFADDPDMPSLAREKVARPLYGVTARAVALADTLSEAAPLLEHAVTALTHASDSGGNSLMPLTDSTYTIQQLLSDLVLRQSHRTGMLLNSRELATLVHFPPATLSKKLLDGRSATKAVPPYLTNEAYRLGLNSHQGVGREVGIDTFQRLRHIHILGATGTGKSTLLHSLIMQDIEHGEGLCLIDPHGDLVEAVLNNIPQERIKDVVLIDPTDSQFPVGLNILLAHSDLEKELLASDLVALFRRFSTSWGDQMNSVFANAISAFVYNTKIGTLGDLRKFLIEQPFRNSVLATCTDPDIVYYWQKEYPILKSSSIGSILTRLDSFLRPKVIRNMVCQQRSLNFQDLMDSRKIVLVKLSQGLLGEENSYLLGAFIVSKLQQTAMSRQTQAQHERVPFYCYIDEFQHFVTPSMNTILSGARKYSFGLVLAHQDMQQVSKSDNDIASSVLSNAGTRICFRLGDADAKRMQEGLASFTAEDLQNLSTGEAIVRVNTKDQDFNIAVVPFDNGGSFSHKAEIVEHSRAAYSVPVVTTMPSDLPPPQAPPEPVPKAPTPPPYAPPVADAPAQKEVRQHRYLQTFIKKLAEEHGYRAGIEVPTPDGNGQVDVLLERDGRHIAIEISVSTSAAWELHNIQKCLAAKYERIVVCSDSAGKIMQMQALVMSELSAAEQSLVSIITADDIPALFAKSLPKGTTAVVKGYRVKVQYEQSGGASNSDIIQRIMEAGRR